MKAKPSNIFAAIGLTLLFLLLFAVFCALVIVLVVFVLSLFSKTVVFNGALSALSLLTRGEFDINWFLTIIIIIVPFALTGLCLGGLISKNETTEKITMTILGILFIATNVVFGVINLIAGSSVFANILLIFVGIFMLSSRR